MAPSTVSPMSLPLVAEIVLTLTLIVVMVMAIVGNSMVCMAIARSRSLRAQVANVFIINLAITDLGCATLVMPFSLVSVWFDRWVFGGFLCDAACFFNYCFIIVSMLSLALISVDRHIYVVHPFRYAMLMTHKRAILLVFLTWIVGFIFASAPPIMSWVIFDNAELICAINWEGNHAQILSYTISAFVICFMSPIFVMVYAYVGIYKVARSHAKRIAPPHFVSNRVGSGDGRKRPSVSTSDGLDYSHPDIKQPQNGKKASPQRTSRERVSSAGRKIKGPSVHSVKAIRSILIMILAYLICNTPFSLTKLIKVINRNNEVVPFYVNTAAAWFGFINPCCNPIIYSITREDFRQAFYKLLPNCISKRLRKDNTDDNTMVRSVVQNSPRVTPRLNTGVKVTIIQPSPERRSSLVAQSVPDPQINGFMADDAEMCDKDGVPEIQIEDVSSTNDCSTVKTNITNNSSEVGSVLSNSTFASGSS